MDTSKILFVTRYVKDLEYIFEVVYKSTPDKKTFMYQTPSPTVKKFIEESQETKFTDPIKGEVSVFQKGAL